MSKRINREQRTLTVMVRMYCRHKHGQKKDLCPECTTLEQYARKRTSSCKFGEEKPVCSLCKVHCYNQTMGQAIREVMRFSGPRMMVSYPLLAFAHFIDIHRNKNNINNKHE